MGHLTAVFRHLAVIPALRQHHSGTGPALISKPAVCTLSGKTDRRRLLGSPFPGFLKANLEYITDAVPRQHPAGKKPSIPGHPEAALPGPAPDPFAFRILAVLAGICRQAFQFLFLHSF